MSSAEDSADLIWDHCDLVVGKVELLQLSESADRIWDLSDLVVGEVEVP